MTAVTPLLAIDGEAKRLAKLSEYEYARELPRSAAGLNIPVSTMERRVALFRAPGAQVVGAAELGKRLARLVFLLGGDEPAVAAEAIGHALRSAGRDWDYLAGLVERAEPAPEVSEDAESWIRAGEAILGSSGLTEREREFVLDMVERFRSRWGFEPTEKQVGWFKKIYLRYVGAKG